MYAKEWLSQECSNIDLSFKDGHAFIPIRKVKEKLQSDLIIDWELQDFRFSVFKANNTTYASASGRLVVMFKNYSEEYPNEYSLDRPGAATLRINPETDTNQNYEASIMSEVIKNAAKNLGNQFGFHLNREESEDFFESTPSNTGDIFDDIDTQVNKQKNAAKK